METFTFLIICLFCVLFFGLGLVIGFLLNEYGPDYNDYTDLPTHPEFYDEDGNFIDEELLCLRFLDDEDDDEENWEKQT